MQAQGIHKPKQMQCVQEEKHTHGDEVLIYLFSKEISEIAAESLCVDESRLWGCKVSSMNV